MAVLECAVRVRRPPIETRATDVAGKGQKGRERSAECRTDPSSPHPEGHCSPSEDGSDNPRSRSRIQRNPDPQSCTQRPQLENGLYIDVPYLSDKEDYEHLPGYSAVLKIIRETKPGYYIVKLRSGEVDLVSVSLDNVLNLCLFTALLTLT